MTIVAPLESHDYRVLNRKCGASESSTRVRVLNKLARKVQCMTSGEFREGRRPDAKQLVRPEFNTRLGMTKTFQRLVDERIDQKRRQACRCHPAAELLDGRLLILDRLTCFLPG